jgi:hypothetical protein
MGAGRSRPGGMLTMLGACLVAVLVGLGAPAVVITAWAAQGAQGSSCAHPWRASYLVGGPEGGFEGDQKRIEMSGTPRKLTWVVWPEQGNVICSVRIELADGKLGRPTRLLPYSTPTPVGGEYRAPHGPHSPLRAVIVTAAKSPVPPGSSCNYPVFGSQSVDGAPAEGADTKDLSVTVKVVSDPNPGSTEPTRLRLEVDIHNPRVVICRAFLTVVPSDGHGAKTIPVSITSGGTVTSEDIEVPADYAFAGVVYARLR